MRDDFNENLNDSNYTINNLNETSILNNSSTFNDSFAAKVTKQFYEAYLFYKNNLEANTLFGIEMGGRN